MRKKMDLKQAQNNKKLKQFIKEKEHRLKSSRS